MDTITITNPELGILTGDTIIITASDHRWWRRFLYWILRKGNPVRKTTHTIISSSVNTFTITG